jgi:lysyl-tRNA synthetase class II
MATEEDLIAARKKHAEQLAQLGISAYPSGFRGDDSLRRALLAIAADPARCGELPNEEALAEDAPHYPLFGRVMAKRGPFLVIATPHGSAQALVRPERLPAPDAAQYAAVDLADHVAVRGPLMRTRTGALAVAARS